MTDWIWQEKECAVQKSVILDAKNQISKIGPLSWETVEERKKVSWARWFYHSLK